MRSQKYTLNIKVIANYLNNEEVRVINENGIAVELQMIFIKFIYFYRFEYFKIKK